MYDLGKQFHFNMEMAKSRNECIIKGNNFRFTILTERLIRIEYSKTGIFVDAPSELALYRNFPIPKFDIIQDSKYVELSTKYFKLSYTKDTPITSSSLKILLKDTEYMWYYGHPEVKTYDGLIDSLDEKETYTKGLYSLDGFSSIDDSNSMLIDPVGNFVNRPKDNLDIYVFMYNNDFELALKDYIMLTGKPQMIPRYALGNWWSKNYAYNDKSLEKLFNRFEKEEIPISVLLLDTDWHITENKYITGYTFNNNLIHNPSEFIKELHNKGIRLGLNINPIEGIHPHEAMFNKLNEYIKAPNDKDIPFAPFNVKFIDIYLKFLLN